jgi:hypothetical protein
MKFINCFIFFWVIFVLLDTDHESKPIESGSSLDPILQHRFQHYVVCLLLVLNKKVNHAGDPCACRVFLH